MCSALVAIVDIDRKDAAQMQLSTRLGSKGNVVIAVEDDGTGARANPIWIQDLVPHHIFGNHNRSCELSL
jgi:hypothetical protein